MIAGEMSCPRCRATNRAEANFCRRCGVLLEGRCPRCGQERVADSDFCDNCGLPLSPQAWLDQDRLGSADAGAARPSGPDPGALAPDLRQYIPRELKSRVDAAQASGGMVGERRIVTMLFCDIKGSTAMAGHLDPEEWADVMKGTVEHLVTPVYRYEGTVAQLLGDGILAFFGAPIAHEDDAQRAVLAGLDIVAAIREYGVRVERERGLSFDVRVGINTGLVVIDQVGSDLRIEFTAMGDAVNVAARMEQTARPGTVQVSGATHRLIRPLFELEDLGGIEIKGKDEPVQAYRVLARKAEAVRFEAVSGDEGPLVGRDHEMAALGAALGRAREGFGAVVCLIGDAGLGKTRLVRELKASFLGEGGGESWFETGSRSYEATRPYALFGRLIRRLARAGPNDPADVLRQKIAGLFDGLAADQRAQWQRVVESVLGVPDVSGEPPLEGETFKQLFLAANRILWKGLAVSSSGSARGRPAVMVCDDLHWADTASVELLFQLLALTDEAPLLVVCSFRPDRQAPCWRLKVVADAEYAHRYTEVALEPLSEPEADALLQAVLPGAEVPAVTRARILAKASGVPFFIEEVARSLIDRGLIERRNGGFRWAASTSVDEIDVPDNLQALLVARIDRLDEPSRGTLQLAAVAGPAFFYRVLASIAGEKVGLDRQIATLVRADMIRETSREPELQYTFRSLLTHEAAYNTILLRHRREFHRRVGDALESLFPERREELAPVLAHHFSEARDDARAQHYLTVAGDAAYRLSAYVEAVAHYSAALERAERVGTPTPELSRLYTLRGRALELGTRYEEALASYTEMAAVAARRGDPALRLGALVARGTVHSTKTPLYDEALAEALAAEGLALARDLGDRTAAARINWNLMLVMLGRAREGDLNRALGYGEASVAIARESNLREQMALTLNDLVMIYNTLALPERANAAAEESRQLFRELGNLPMLADSYGQASYRLARSGDLDGALAAATECRRISESIGNLWNLGSSGVVYGWVHTERGEVGRAIEALDAVIGLTGMERLPFIHGLLLMSLAQGYETLGATERAMDSCRRVIGGPASVLPDAGQWAHAILTGLHVSRNDIGEAQAEIATVRTDMNREGLMALLTVPLVFSAHGALALATGDFPRALSLMDELERLSGVLHCEACLPQTLYLKGQALRGLGRRDEALEALGRACVVAQAMGERRYAWRILASLSEIETERGDATRAQLLLGRAREVIDHIASHAGSAELRESFLDIRAVRAVLAQGRGSRAGSSASS
jgi:class 3 adenylate cyclase/tetratricopeptide (TPR) repeat protein